MNVTEKWRHMMASFEDIRAAAAEKGAVFSDNDGYGSYANAVRKIYSNTAGEEYPYPQKNGNITEYAVNLLDWCGRIKEQIRLAITGSGVDCGEAVPLAEYGGKIRQISADLVIITDSLPYAQQGVEYSARLEAEGGVPPYTWKHISGVKPAGININADGTVTGIATSVGLYKAINIGCTESTGRSKRKKISLEVL